MATQSNQAAHFLIRGRFPITKSFLIDAIASPLRRQIT